MLYHERTEFMECDSQIMMSPIFDAITTARDFTSTFSNDLGSYDVQSTVKVQSIALN